MTLGSISIDILSLAIGLVIGLLICAACRVTGDKTSYEDANIPPRPSPWGEP